MPPILSVILQAFVLCIALVGMFSYLGLHVIKRGIIFVDLALAQIAALGTLIAFIFGIPLHTQASYWFSVALTAIAAVIFTLCRFRESRVPQEAIIGLTYAIAAAVAILLIDKAPHGAEHVKETLTGSILWVEWPTIVLITAAYAAVGLFHYVFRRNFLLISEDPERARRAGINVRTWDFLFYLSFGFVITLSVGTAGVLLVFVFLVAPAVMATLITDRLWHQLLFGWGLGLFTTTIGLTVSAVADLPAGPLVIAAYAVALLVVGTIVYNLRAPDRSRSLRITAATFAFFAVAFGLLFLAGRSLGRTARAEAAHSHEAHALELTEAARDASGGSPARSEEASLAPEPMPDLQRIAEPDVLRRLFDEQTDPSARSAIVRRALDVDPRVGAAMALDFLAHDPPLLFRDDVVGKLNEVMPGVSGFDVESPFAAEVNQKAAAKVRAEYGLR
ncbi:MAG: metal ABC transporter permease [Armatimonadota bacterium]